MRTVLAAAAAGALLLGSAGGGAVAKPSAKPAEKPGYMQVRMVNLHNGTFDLYSTPPVTVKSKVNVWDSVKDVAPKSVTVTLAQYDAKGGKLVDGGVTITSLPMTTKAGTDKKSKNYYANIDLTSLKSKVTATPVTLCLSQVNLDGTNVKVQKRQVTKKVGTDCIIVVNTTPVAP